MISWFRVFGVLAWLGGVMLLIVVGLSVPTPLAGRPAISALWFEGAALVVIGTGLLAHRKWAAGLFAAATLVYGARLLSSLLFLPLDIALTDALLGLVLLVPLWATVRYWRLLAWRGRWCF